MSPFGYTVVLILLVLFLITILSCLAKKGTESIITKTADDPDFAEMVLRDILKRNPECEIYITEAEKNEETLEIINRLSRDYPQIHIKN